MERMYHISFQRNEVNDFFLLLLCISGAFLLAAAFGVMLNNPKQNEKRNYDKIDFQQKRHFFLLRQLSEIVILSSIKGNYHFDLFSRNSDLKCEEIVIHISMKL